MNYWKPRVSLKWLFLGFAAAAVGVYLLYVYPTQRAKNLIAGINSGEVNPYDFVDLPTTVVATLAQPVKITNRAATEAQLAPRTWNDTLHLRRRVLARMTWQLEDPQRMLLDEVRILSTLTGPRALSRNIQLIRYQSPQKP